VRVATRRLVLPFVTFGILLFVAQIPRHVWAEPSPSVGERAEGLRAAAVADEQIADAPPIEEPSAPSEPEARFEEEPAEPPEFIHFTPPAPAPPISLSFPELPPSSLDPRLTSEVSPAASEAGDLIKAILGLVLILALAYIGGMPRIRAIFNRLRISHILTTGLPFLVLGVVFRLPSVGILSDSILDQIRPILPFGLGWLGLAIGFRFDARGVDRPPPYTAETLVWLTFVPFVLMLGVAWGFLYYANPGEHLVNLGFAAIVATAGTVSGRITPLISKETTDSTGLGRLAYVIQMEQLAAILLLASVAALIRPEDGMIEWTLPGMMWIFITLGFGVVMGGLAFIFLAIAQSKIEVSLVLLGIIAFASGLSSFLNIPPTIVCFIVGLILANIPGMRRTRLRGSLARLEGPIYLVFLFLAGAHWRVTDIEGWALLIAFITSRLLGKQIGATALEMNTKAQIADQDLRGMAFSPMGALAIAIAISAQDLYPSVEATWVVTAVIGGAIASEIIVQILGRGASTSAPPAKEESA